MVGSSPPFVARTNRMDEAIFAGVLSEPENYGSLAGWGEAVEMRNKSCLLQSGLNGFSMQLDTKGFDDFENGIKTGYAVARE